MQNWGLDRVSRDIMHAHCTPFIDHFVHAFHVFKNKLSVKSVVLLKSCTFLHHWVSCKGVADGLQDFRPIFKLRTVAFSHGMPCQESRI